MEITEPVVLQIQQGRKTVRLELASRADGRDLIAAIASAMLRLPDDGEGHVDSHGEHAEMGNHDLNDALDRLSPSGIEQAVHYAHGYCAAGIEQAIRHQLEQDARPPREPEPASPEAAERLYDAIVAGTPVLVTDDKPERLAAASNSACCSRPGCAHVMADHSDYRVADEAGCSECACQQWTDTFASVTE